MCANRCLREGGTDEYQLSVVIDFRGESEIGHYPDPEISGKKT